ncbi:hypothetical protein JL722_13573 [Aureococcus anophagefferens]|nr:hypothetical protein JL722_13573 [Aureococcus anophagefferens]
MIRVDLRITDADLKDSDVAAFLRVVDEDGSGFVSVSELADFVVHGISHFYNDEALDGKNLALPLPRAATGAQASSGASSRGSGRGRRGPAFRGRQRRLAAASVPGDFVGALAEIC